MGQIPEDPVSLSVGVPFDVIAELDPQPRVDVDRLVGHLATWPPGHMAAQLESDGYEVTARWIDGLQEGHPDLECALNDEEDIRQDILVFFAENSGKGDRGGGGVMLNLALRTLWENSLKKICSIHSQGFILRAIGKKRN